MGLSPEQRQALVAPLNPNRVATRKQGGSTLSFLEAWEVKRALIRLFGFGGFSATAHDMRILHIENDVPRATWSNGNRVTQEVERNPDGTIKFGTANFRVTASVAVTLVIHQLGASYTEYAASSQTGPDIGEVADFAIKTAESDALKRAAIYLGTQFGLSLYNNGSTADIVNFVLAPGQEWPPREEPEGVRPRDGAVGALPFEGGLTPEKRAETEALVSRALSAKRQTSDTPETPGGEDA